MSKRPIHLLLNDIDLEIIWQILHKDLPELKQRIMSIVKNEQTG